MLLLLVAAAAWWGAAVRADRFDEAAVLPAGVGAGTLRVPVGERVVLWSSTTVADGRPRCVARDLTFDQQLALTEPVHAYRRGLLAGSPGDAVDRVLPSRWRAVAVLHTGGSRLRLTCDPASAGDLAVSAEPATVAGVGALRHGWNLLAVCAAVMTLSGAGLLLGAVRTTRRGNARAWPAPEAAVAAAPEPGVRTSRG